MNGKFAPLRRSPKWRSPPCRRDFGGTTTAPQPLLPRIAALEAQLAAILKITGLSVEDWVSPHKAKSLISLSRHQIKQLVDRAETARTSDRRCTLQLGTHYRFVPPTGNLQINWQRWEAVLAMPPEQWEGLE